MKNIPRRAKVTTNVPVLVLAPLVFFAAGGGLFAQGDGGEWVEFETIDQSALPIVRAKLNGSGGYRIVLDVSFTDFILDTVLVAGSGLQLANEGKTATIDFYGKKEKVPVAVLDELRVGDLEFSSVRTLLIEGEDGTGSGGLRSYGRIGRDLLEPLRLTVNYPRHLLYLEPSPADVPAGGVALRTAGRFLLVSAVVSGEGFTEEVPFVIDCGTSSTIIDRKWAKKRGLVKNDAPSAKLEGVQIGSFQAAEVPVLLGVMKELPYEGEAVGVIGADLLLGLSVTYDFARDLIWLVSVTGESS
jgi:hypothetical protein